jgi:pyruvate kinase
VHVEVKGGGMLSSRINIKLPSGKHDNLPILHPLDEGDLISIAIKNNFDFVSVPYTIRKRDI